MFSIAAPSRPRTERADHEALAAHDPPPPWTLPAGLVLITSLLVGAFALVAAVVGLWIGLTNDAEWLLYLLTLSVLAPGAFVGGRWLAQGVDAAGGPRAVAALAVISAVGILTVLIVARAGYAAEDSTSGTLLPLALLWAGAVVFASGRALRGEPIGEQLLAGRELFVGRVGALSPWLAFVVLLCLALLMFFPPRFFGAGTLVASLAIAAGLFVAHERWRGTAPAWTRRLLDVAVIVAVIMIVSDVSGYHEYLRSDAREPAFRELTIPPEVLAYFHRFHQDLWLATINDMMGGRTLLTDTTSQYGAGVLYFLAGYFQVAPLGYGALGLLTGFLTALQLVLAYGVLRLAGVRQMLAIPAIIAAVLGLVMGLLGSFNDYPSAGALRFGLPWLVVLLALLAVRRPQRQRALWIAAGIVVAFSSVWSFETFAYAAVAFTTAAAFDAAWTHRCGGRWMGVVLRRIAGVAALSVALYALLAVTTRVASGSWPDPSEYLAYLSVYGSGVNLLYGTTVPWSAGLPMLLVHLASLLCLGALVTRRHELVIRHRPALVTIAATSGLGIASHTYWVGNSVHEALFFVGLPVVVVTALWLSIASDERERMPAAFGLVALAIGLWFAATLGISGMNDTVGKWRRTAAAHVLPFGGANASLPDAVSTLWNNPPSDYRTPAAQAMLDRYLPARVPALVLLDPDLTVETLVRSRRINVLPIDDAEQTSLVPELTDPKVIRTIDALRTGTPMLTSPVLWNQRTSRSMDPADGFVRIQRLALDRIRARFELPIVEQGPHGLVIVRLVAKS